MQHCSSSFNNRPLCYLFNNCSTEIKDWTKCHLMMPTDPTPECHTVCIGASTVERFVILSNTTVWRPETHPRFPLLIWLRVSAASQYKLCQWQNSLSTGNVHFQHCAEWESLCRSKVGTVKCVIRCSLGAKFGSASPYSWRYQLPAPTAIFFSTSFFSISQARTQPTPNCVRQFIVNYK